MPNPLYDLRYLQSGQSSLEEFVLSADLFWPITISSLTGEPPYPSLTIEGILLAQKRLMACALSLETQSEIAIINHRIEDIRSRWRSAWSRKAARAFHARLNLWRNFLQEVRGDPPTHGDRYAYEVRQRLMLQLLLSEADNVPQAEADLLTNLDQLLKSLLLPDKFIWEAEIKSGFPQETYWYLYGRMV